MKLIINLESEISRIMSMVILKGQNSCIIASLFLCFFAFIVSLAVWLSWKLNLKIFLSLVEG